MRKLHAALALALAALASQSTLAAPPSRDVSKTLPLPAGENVRVDTYKGSVKVAVWDRREVAVEARIEADGDCGSAERQARWVEQTRVVIETTTGGISIKSDYDALEESLGWFGGCTARPFVRYTIQMPKDAPLKIKDYKSDLAVKGLEADLAVDTYKGTVNVAGLAGGLRIETYKGDVRAEIVRLTGNVRAETYKGSIVLHLPDAAAFELSADSGRHGHFRSDFPVPVTSDSVRGRSLLVQGAVNGGGARVSLKTDKGAVTLRKG